MNLLLLSMNVGAVPNFLEESIGKAAAGSKIALLSDAGVPYQDMGMISFERDRLEKLGLEVKEIRARDLSPESFSAQLDAVNAVYACGGNTFSLMEALQISGNASVLTQKVRAGLPYIGCSAGSVVAGPYITPVEVMDEREAAPQLQSDTGLRLIDQVIIPHADGKISVYPEEMITKIVAAYSGEFALRTLHDDQALRVWDEGAQIVESA